MSDMVNIGTTMPELEAEAIVGLSQNAVDEEVSPRYTDRTKPVTRAEAVRLAIRFALDNPEQFKNWYNDNNGKVHG